MNKSLDSQPTEHTIKCVNPHFDAMWRGLKTFDMRKNDRFYESGDILKQREYSAKTDTYSGRVIVATVLHVTYPADYDVIPYEYCIMSVRVERRYYDDTPHRT